MATVMAIPRVRTWEFHHRATGERPARGLVRWCILVNRDRQAQDPTARYRENRFVLPCQRRWDAFRRLARDQSAKPPVRPGCGPFVGE
jgi:hypothetical protein